MRLATELCVVIKKQTQNVVVINHLNVTFTKSELMVRIRLRDASGCRSARNNRHLDLQHTHCVCNIEHSYCLLYCHITHCLQYISDAQMDDSTSTLSLLHAYRFVVSFTDEYYGSEEQCNAQMGVKRNIASMNNRFQSDSNNNSNNRWDNTFVYTDHREKKRKKKSIMTKCLFWTKEKKRKIRFSVGSQFPVHLFSHIIHIGNWNVFFMHVQKCRFYPPDIIIIIIRCCLLSIHSFSPFFFLSFQFQA